MQKQAGRTKADVAVSLSLGGYNLSHYLKVIPYHPSTFVKLGLGFQISPLGFFIISSSYSS
jgi:hypothetical protein